MSFSYRNIAANDAAAFANAAASTRPDSPAQPVQTVHSAPADRLIQGGGTPESVWLADPEVARAAPVTLDSIVGRDARLVVVAPHPDDEVLSCGGLMALHAQRGGKTLVLAVTDGEASHADSDQWTPAALAAARRLESANGLSRLAGAATAVLRLGLPDGQVAALQPELVKRLQPLLHINDVVVVTWQLDGHPDHDAAGAAARTACARVGCKLFEAPVWMWHWSQPGDQRVPWQRLRALGLPPPVVQAKREALAAHHSQLQPRAHAEGPVLGAHIVERAGRHAEYFFV